MNKTFPLTLLLLFLFGFINIVPVHGVTISSREIIIDVDDDTGRINLSAVVQEGDTSGVGGVNLLFYDKPPSSYTVIYLNGDLITYGGDRGRFTKRPIFEEKTIGSVWEIDGVRVFQQVQLIERKDTGAQDGILISYRLENRRTKAVEVGLRILFDTYLGERDIYHFELSGDQQVRYETMFEDESLPDYWVSQEKDKPHVCLRGVLKGELVTKPDKVIFANYRILKEEPFDYEVKRKKKFDLLPYSKNDSAVAILYRPVSLQPSSSREYSTILGLCKSGEYSLLDKFSPPEEKEEIVEIEEAVKEEKVTPQLDMESIVRDLESLGWERKPLERINKLIEKLNVAVEDQGKSLSDDAIMLIRNELNTLLKGE